MSVFPDRYIKRVNGALVDGIPAIVSSGAVSSGRIVATGPDGLIDPSFMASGSLSASGYVRSLNSLAGVVGMIGINGTTVFSSGNTIVVSGGGGSSFNASGDVISSGGLARVVGFEGTPISLSGALVDGMTWQYIAASGAWVPVFDRATRPTSAIAGKPGAGQLVLIYTAETLQTYPANFAGSVGSCRNAPAATATYSIYKNNTLVGNVSIPAGAVGNFTFSTVGGTSLTLNVNDVLYMVAPATQDTTLSDVGITLVGTRGSVAAISTSSYPVITWKGSFSNVTNYNVYDMVSYNGSSYIAIQSTYGNLPTNTSYWGLMAQAGSNGQVSYQDFQNETTVFCVDSGALYHPVVAPSQAVTALASGLRLMVQMANPCSGASVIDVSGFTNIPIVKNGGTALSGGEWYRNQIVQLVRDTSGNMQIVGGAAATSSSSSFPAALQTPDYPPTSPTSYDDEFTGTSLSGIWTWVNQGSASTTVGGSYLSLKAPLNSGTNFKAIVQTPPATPYIFAAKVQLLCGPNNYVASGIYLSDGTKLIQYGQAYNGGYKTILQRYNTTTSFNSSPWNFSFLPVTAWCYLAVKNDGTNLTYYASLDGYGIPGTSGSWYALGSESKTAFLSTITQIGICLDVETTANDGYLICDWFRRLL